MKIAFKLVDKNNAQSLLIAHFLHSDIVHCELEIGVKRYASWKNIGVAEITNTNTHEIKYDLGTGFEEKVIEWFKKNNGKPYNWAGIAGGMIYDLGISGKGYNCTDACYSALKYAGFPLPKIDSDQITPEILMKIIEKNGYKRISK